MTGITDARGNTTRYQFDGNNRLTVVNHPDGTVRTHIYDCCTGTATIDENGNKDELIRNPLLQVEQWMGPTGDRTLFNYDLNGNLITMTDALGRSLALTYDSAGRVTRITDPLGGVQRPAYDPQGNLISLLDERGKQTRLDYDAHDLPVRLIDPLGQAFIITRDSLGRLQTATNARGGKITHNYDADGRLIARSYDDVEVAVFKYDACSNLTSMHDPTGETAYTYDAAGRTTSISYPDGLKLVFSYDSAGNIHTITYPGGLIVSYGHDVRDRVARIAWGEDFISFRYDPTGNLVGESRSNGTESAYSHDANNSLIGIVHQKGLDAFVRISCTRDAVGNVIDESADLPLGPASDGISTTTTYNDVDQILALDGDRYTYDADGNMIRISGGKWQAHYDAADRLLEVRRKGHTDHYAYDGLGQRSKASTGPSARNFHYDGMGRLMFETYEDGRIKACYVYRGEALVARVGPGGNTHFYHFDKTWNTLAMTGSDGNVLTAYAYSPFGAVMNQSRLADENPFTFVGRYGVMDDGDGLFFMKNRYYDAHTGRFLQKDPAGFTGGTNLYAYTGNNPVNFIDPEGTGGFLVPMIFFGVAVALAAWKAKKQGEKLAGEGGIFGSINQAITKKPGDPPPIVPTPKEAVKQAASPFVTVAKETYGILPKAICGPPAHAVEHINGIAPNVYPNDAYTKGLELIELGLKGKTVYSAGAEAGKLLTGTENVTHTAP
jgi:RHS repeat-associated protein